MGVWQKEHLQQVLHRLAIMPARWDGENALPVDRDVLHYVRDFVQLYLMDVHAEPWIVALPSGGIRLEWISKDAKLCLEIWFSVDDFIDYHFRDANIYPTWGVTRQLTDPFEQLHIPLERVSQYCPPYPGNTEWLRQQQENL